MAWADDISLGVVLDSGNRRTSLNRPIWLRAEAKGSKRTSTLRSATARHRLCGALHRFGSAHQDDL